MKRSEALAFIYAASIASRNIGNAAHAPINHIPKGILIAAHASGEYHPRKHTKQSYRSQQRAAQKRRQSF